MSIEVGVNGFGRIGMLYSRIGLEDPDTTILAINTGGELDAHDTAVRLEFDSVHGEYYNHIVEEGHNSIIVDRDNVVGLYSFRNPEDAPWGEISKQLVVVDATGSNLTRETLKGHLTSGAKRVVITAPSKDSAIPTIVRGVNDDLDSLSGVEDIVATSSCSTNCIAPILKALGSEFDVKWGVADIPHAITNSQRPLDGRGVDTASRRSLTSMLPAATGSAKEVLKLFPDLDFFRSESMRVNIADGSVAMLTIGLAGRLAAQNIVDVLSQAEEESHKGIIKMSDRGMFLERVLGQSFSSVIDPRSVTVDHTGDQSVVKIQAWFDNEWGYANRVAEVAKLVGELI